MGTEEKFRKLMSKMVVEHFTGQGLARGCKPIINDKLVLPNDYDFTAGVDTHDRNLSKDHVCCSSNTDSERTGRDVRPRECLLIYQFCHLTGHSTIVSVPPESLLSRKTRPRAQLSRTPVDHLPPRIVQPHKAGAHRQETCIDPVSEVPPLTPVMTVTEFYENR